MTVEQIKQKKAEYKEELATAQGAVDVAVAKLKSLHRFCEHPNMKKYSSMGESGQYCPDCGYEW